MHIIGKIYRSQLASESRLLCRQQNGTADLTVELMSAAGCFCISAADVQSGMNEG